MMNLAHLGTMSHPRLIFFLLRLVLWYVCLMEFRFLFDKSRSKFETFLQLGGSLVVYVTSEKLLSVSRYSARSPTEFVHVHIVDDVTVFVSLDQFLSSQLNRKLSYLLSMKSRWTVFPYFIGTSFHVLGINYQ